MTKVNDIISAIAAVFAKKWWMQPSTLLTRLNALDGDGDDAIPVLLRWQYFVLGIVAVLAMLAVSAAG